MAIVGVVGAGSWGTALAKLLCENGHRVILWARRAELMHELRAGRQNADYLPGIVLPEELRFTTSLAECAANAEHLIVTVPSHHLRDVLRDLGKPPEGCTLVSAVKGIEPDTDLRMSQVIAAVSGNNNPVAALSGPTLAAEVALHHPSAAVVASEDDEACRKVQSLFMGPYFRVYAHRDLAGVELGGALKNIIALAAGIVDGVGFGDNTKAALMTRGLVEITRLGGRMGADPITFAGLSGMGDLMVTCMSKKSRNRFVGEQIGLGKRLREVQQSMNMVAEGVRTTAAAYSLAARNEIEMPITSEVYQVLFADKEPKLAVKDLMVREAKRESFG